jgi:hypothetical protein
LINEDLPTLDLPINANSGALSLGLWSSFWLLPANVALVILIAVVLDAKIEKISYICKYE